MTSDRIALAIARMDRCDQAEIDAAWADLRPLGFSVVPYLRAAYGQFSHWQGRTSLVYYATRYARQSDDAVALGRMALADRSYMVRYRACGLLAYALDKESLDALRQLADSEKRPLVQESALAAIAAIEAGNHHLFVDRSGSGRSTWVVNPGDRQPSPTSIAGRIRSWLGKR